MDGMEKNVLHVTYVRTNEANNKKPTDDGEREKNRRFIILQESRLCLLKHCVYSNIV